MAKKIFVSMPMAGKSKEEIEQEQFGVLVAVANELNEEVELMETYIEGDYSPLGYLAESLKLMDKADYAAFVKGWENARGCKIERACAEAYGVPYFDVEKN